MFSFSASKRDRRQSFDLVEDKGHKEGLKKAKLMVGSYHFGRRQGTDLYTESVKMLRVQSKVWEV